VCPVKRVSPLCPLIAPLAGEVTAGHGLNAALSPCHGRTGHGRRGGNRGGGGFSPLLSEKRIFARRFRLSLIYRPFPTVYA